MTNFLDVRTVEYITMYKYEHFFFIPAQLGGERADQLSVFSSFINISKRFPIHTAYIL